VAEFINLLPNVLRSVGAVDKLVFRLVTNRTHINGNQQKKGETSGEIARKTFGYETKLRHDCLLQMKIL
jgi:hypothetical protein